MNTGTSRQTLGIIAGAGRFPFMVAAGARKTGCHVTVIGLRGFADPALMEVSDSFVWAGIARLGKWIRVLKRRRIERVILAGSVTKSSMYGRWRLLRLLPDWSALKLWFFTIPDKRNDTVLAAVADELQKHGITMDECVRYSEDDMAPEGVLTPQQPSSHQQDDATFGWRIAKELGRLDIGQSVAVKETEIIAVEAIEGTDRMIERAGELCRRGGWTLVKVAKPDQDMRFDVPTVGPETIAKLYAHGAKALIIEAGKTVIVDRDEMIRRATECGIVVVSLRGET